MKPSVLRFNRYYPFLAFGLFLIFVPIAFSGCGEEGPSVSAVGTYPLLAVLFSTTP